MMSKETPEAQILKEGVKITLDAENRFDITFELNAPAYYGLGRNSLSLTPGDDLELFCDMNENLVTFKGDAVEACEYLKAKPFPKSESYLGGGRILEDKPIKKAVRDRIEIKVTER